MTVYGKKLSFLKIKSRSKRKPAGFLKIEVKALFNFTFDKK